MYLLIVSLGNFSAVVLHVFAYKIVGNKFEEFARDNGEGGSRVPPPDNVWQNRYIYVIAD